MSYGPPTPEDLETLLEDTLMLENHEALTELFEEGGSYDRRCRDPRG